MVTCTNAIFIFCNAGVSRAAASKSAVCSSPRPHLSRSLQYRIQFDVSSSEPSQKKIKSCARYLCIRRQWVDPSPLRPKALARSSLDFVRQPYQQVSVLWGWRLQAGCHPNPAHLFGFETWVSWGQEPRFVSTQPEPRNGVGNMHNAPRPPPCSASM